MGKSGLHQMALLSRKGSSVRTFALPLILAASFGVTTPTVAQDLGNMIGGIAEALLQQEVDRKVYIAAQNANTAAGFRDYLARFPQGQYRTNAENALARLGAPVAQTAASDAQVEARLRITSAQRVAVQRQLTRLGYQTSGVDGVWGRSTRNAVAAWQRDRGDNVTGYVTAAQLRLLAQGTVVTPPVDGSSSGTPAALQVEATLRLTRIQRSTIQRQLTAIGYDAGVADGLWGSRTRTAISDWQGANQSARTGYVTAAQIKLIAHQAGPATATPNDTVSGPALEERLLDLTRDERVDMQGRLRQLGYGPMRSDGTFGDTTRRAIAEWQADGGETATGYLTADQVRLILAETGG